MGRANWRQPVRKSIPAACLSSALIAGAITLASPVTADKATAITISVNRAAKSDRQPLVPPAAQPSSMIQFRPESRPPNARYSGVSEHSAHSLNRSGRIYSGTARRRWRRPGKESQKVVRARTAVSFSPFQAGTLHHGQGVLPEDLQCDA